MAEVLVGRVPDFADDTRRVVLIGGREVVVFMRDGRAYAVENKCPHQGGPVGEGLLMGKVEAICNDRGELLGERFSEDEIHLVCPWHGWEWDIDTGQHAGDRRRRLRMWTTRREGDEVYVIA
jgi:nitrite reductase/ring-hydroxylating ferredoxin subunit